MIANYHTHTPRCKHAVGDEREYVEQAIEGGLKILGFSDHVPIPYEGSYRSPVRMDVSELESYVDAVLAVKKEYAREIEIHLGFEVEYHPRYIDAQLSLFKPYPIEFFLLGQHFPADEEEGPYSGFLTRSDEVLKTYVRTCRTAMETGLFTYFAHPDLIYYEGDEALYEREMRSLCACAKAAGMPLEINLLGIEDGRNYPKEAFWRIAGETGCAAVLGSDAHRPGNVYREDAIRAGEALAERNGLPVLETVPLIRPEKARTQG